MSTPPTPLPRRQIGELPRLRLHKKTPEKIAKSREFQPVSVFLGWDLRKQFVPISWLANDLNELPNVFFYARRVCALENHKKNPVHLQVAVGRCRAYLRGAVPRVAPPRARWMELVCGVGEFVTQMRDALAGEERYLPVRFYACPPSTARVLNSLYAPIVLI